MNDAPENELFSAYLDGELTAAEQADVEQLLGKSAAARQLIDELRALSATLQSLPAHKLPKDIGEQVLRVAERRMLAEPAGPDQAAEPSAAEPDGETPVWRMILRRALRPRNLLWPAIAVAAAVLIMVMNSGRLPRERKDQAGGPVALALKEESPETGPSIGPPAGAEGEVARRLREVLRDEPGGTERMAKDITADIAKAPASREKAFAAGKDEPSPPAAPSRPSIGPAKFADTDSVPKAEGRAGGLAAPVAKGEAEKLAETSRGAAGRAGAAAEMPAAAKPSEALAVPALSVPAPLVADAMKIPAETSTRKLPGDNRGEGLPLDLKTAEKREDMAGPLAHSADTLSKKAEEPLVVLCAVTPEAVRLGAFERIVKLGETGQLPQKAKRGDERAGESDERILDVELTQSQLNGVLVGLRQEPQFFPFILEGPALADIAAGKAGEMEGPRVVGKDARAGQGALRVQQMETYEAKLGQAALQTAPSQATVAGQSGLQQKAPAAQFSYGTPASQSQMPGGVGWGMDAGAYGGAGGGMAGRGGTGFGARSQPGPGAGAPQATDQVQVQRQVQMQRAAPPAEPAAPGASQQRSPASLSAKGQAAPATELRMMKMKANAMRVQAAAPAPVQARRSASLAQQQDQVEDKRRVLFVLRVVSDVSSPETIAKEEPAAEADAAKAAAAPAKPARAVESQPGGAPANPPKSPPAGPTSK